MTQIKLWQIVSKTRKALILSDGQGNLIALSPGTEGQVLVLGNDGYPVWVDNAALAAAIDAKSTAVSALADAKAFTQQQIAALVDNAPVALDTLRELADKLGDQDSALGALILQLDQKAEIKDVYTKTQTDQLLQQISVDLAGNYGVVSEQIGVFYGYTPDTSAAAATSSGIKIVDMLPVGNPVFSSDPRLNIQMVLVNGVAMEAGWEQTLPDAKFSDLMLRFSSEAADKIFNGDPNSIIVVVKGNRTLPLVVKAFFQ